jgi:(1->4)-alpha-D-glucan 1-alpha-D-glucosylmutase
MKFQQFSGPVMAKGLEDTAFYRYHRLVSLNEVGSDLHRFGTTAPEFHLANQDRLRCWPHTMLTTSTHDSKRAEDVRARINVLSELSGLWRIRVREWKRFNRNHKRRVNGHPAPSPSDEYLLYQTLLGAWPSQSLDETTSQTFRERIENYILKAIREAKQKTSWINRNTEYETAVTSFVRTLLTPGTQNRFLKDFLPLQNRIARIGFWNSLAQTLLKLTCPGVPDIYQGSELWDFSLVDPDNRRPVDYASRQEILQNISESSNDASIIDRLLETPESGRIKLYVIWKTLCLRQQRPSLFDEGEYLPLEVKGPKAEQVVAFARKARTGSVVVVVPRLIAGLLNDFDRPPIGPQIWEDTHLLLPSSSCGEKYRNAFTGETIEPGTADGQTNIAISEILATFPLALCLLESSD